MTDFKKYNCYLIFPFCALHLRLSGEECDNGTKYAASKVDVIHGGKFAISDPSKSLKKNSKELLIINIAY